MRYYVTTSARLDDVVDADLARELPDGDGSFYEFSDADVVRLIGICRAEIQEPEPHTERCPILHFMNGYD
jgi:hypothetical protein